MKIITLTLNPAFDIHCYSEKFNPFSENLVKITSNDAGGKGINISRALTANGIENTAIVVVGDENGESFLKSLASENINYKKIEVCGRIRENITLHSKNDPETRISFSGFVADNAIIDSVKELIEKENLKNSIITLTGRLPDGIDINYVKQFLMFLKDRGAKIIIDSRSFAKEDILDVSPWLIKPNEEEIKMYHDKAVNDEKEAAIAAKELKEQGVENVLISLGGRGAVLCCDDGVFFAKAPTIDVVSTIGAGDSSIAGFLAAMADGSSYKDALKQAIAYGSTACMAEGTQAPDKKEIERISKLITVNSI